MLRKAVSSLDAPIPLPMPSAKDRSKTYLVKAIGSLPESVAKERFRIFLFGPALGSKQVVRRPSSKAGIEKHARFLRYVIRKALQEERWIVDFGESPELLKAWARLRGPIDTGKMEYNHALAACGAIVILPSSPGSFCEMGMFATSKDISKKTLAVVHQEYKKAKSFFRRGLVRIFEQREGRCLYESYRDRDAVVNGVLEFVENKYNSHQWDDLDIAIGNRRRRERAYGQL